MRADLVLAEVLRHSDREGDGQARIAGRGRARGEAGDDRLAPSRAAPAARSGGEQLRGAREQQLQVVVQLGHRADRAARGAHRIGLVDRDRRRHAVDAVHRRAVHAVEELPRVGDEGLDVAALALGVQRVEHQALARAARPGDHASSPVGMSRSRFLRLFWRAPRMRIARRVSSDTSLESSGMGRCGHSPTVPLAAMLRAGRLSRSRRASQYNCME